MVFIHRLACGMTLLFERRAGPGFALDLRLPVGAAHDPPGAEGAAAVLEEWLFRGAGTRDARALAAAFDDLGLRRGGGVTHEETRFGVSGLTADLPGALQLLADVTRRPWLHEGELGVLTDLARQDLEGLQDNPGERLGVELRSRAFAPPYAHPVSGTLHALASLTPGAVRGVYERFGPNGAAVAVIADLPAPQVVELVSAVFADWSGGGDPLPDVRFRDGWYAHLSEESQQTHLSAVFRGFGPTDPRWVPFHLALGVLSGGSASRLFLEVREARGLAYSVGASAQVMGRDGFAMGYAGSTPERADETLEVLLAEFRRLREGVTAAEYERALAQLVTGTVFAVESARGRAGMLTRDWLLLGRTRSPAEVREELVSVSLGDLNEFLEGHPFDHPALMTLGPQPLAAGANVTGGEHVPA